MPYPHQHSGRRWAECNTCGFDWPLLELQTDSFGVRRCPRCYDKDGFEEERANTDVEMEEPFENDFIENVL